MPGNIIGIAVHVQMMVSMAKAWHAEVKRSDPQAERVRRRESKRN
jgi:hypothetical protein